MFHERDTFVFAGIVRHGSLPHTPRSKKLQPHAMDKKKTRNAKKNY